jgi:lipopolysaccharide/colanic/teichoic acid biosynthesis glycosyltransferase
MTASRLTEPVRLQETAARPAPLPWTPEPRPDTGMPLLGAVMVVPERPWYRGAAAASPGYEGMKRVLDVIISLLALPFVILCLAACALAIRLDSPGPAFFTQPRTGKGGRRFRMFKLRTMVQDAEELKARYAHLNELTPPDFRLTNDPRVTRVGHFLRRTSLDELPQLLNVLLGDMTLVGPRPTSFGTDTYQLWHTARLEVKPGLTGLWQISGRNEIDFDDRLQLDIAYIRNRSHFLDFRILLRTFGAVAGGRGAN